MPGGGRFTVGWVVAAVTLLVQPDGSVEARGPYPVGYAGQDRRLRRGAQGRNDSEWQGETVETSPCIEDSKLC